MNAEQTRLYWFEWGACKKALLKHGFAGDELEAQRHRLHIEALGKDKSSKALTNADLDALLSVFRAYSRPDDLNEQLRLIDQPEKRREAFRERAEKLAREVCDARGPEGYLNELARRIIGRDFARCADTGLAKLCGVLEAQARRAREKAKSA